MDTRKNKEKIQISLPGPLLKALDDWAAAEGWQRSTLAAALLAQAIREAKAKGHANAIAGLG